MAHESEKARILTCYYRPKPGGFCRRLFRAIEALLSEGHTVHYLAVQRFPIEHHACHFHRFPWPATKADNPMFWIVFHVVGPFWLLYLGVRHHITHTFAFGSTYGYALQLVRLVKRTPLTIFLRTDIKEHHLHRGRHLLTISIEQLIEGLAIAGNTVYCNARSLTRKVASRHTILKPRSLGTIPNDLPVPRKVNVAVKPHGMPIRLGCVGTLERHKNHALAIECISHFGASEAQLFIFGAGRDEPELRKLVHVFNVTNRVSFMGWKDSPDDIWPAIDILLFPSYQEGSPNAVLEAIAHGVAVLASDIPEHHEILPANSLLAIDSIQSWIHIVKTIAAEPDRWLPMLRSAQNDASAGLRFDWEKEVAKAILETSDRSSLTGGREC